VSFADENRVSLVPVVEYSYCTPDSLGYELGVVGTDWALTFRIPEGSFSGKVQVKGANFFRGPNMRRYIGKSAGPRRPPIPTTNAYTQAELAGINVDVHRIKIYDKVNGPIEVLVNEFVVNKQQFHIPVQVNIVCTGPLP
jgi:hypothetical protein